VAEALGGSLACHGVKTGLKAVLREDSIFVVTDGEPGYDRVRLNISALRRRAQQQPAGAAAAASGFAATAAGCSQPAVAAAGAVRVSSLLQHIRSRRWHASDKQLDVARRALAEHIVWQANADRTTANGDARAYTVLAAIAGAFAAVHAPCHVRVVCPAASRVEASTHAQRCLRRIQCTARLHTGIVMTGAVRAAFGHHVQRSWAKTADAMQGEGLLSTFMSGPSAMSVRLHIQQLLREVAQAPAPTAAAPSGDVSAMLDELADDISGMWPGGSSSRAGPSAGAPAPTAAASARPPPQQLPDLSVLPLPDGLRPLVGLTAAACADARVLVVPEAELDSASARLEQQPPELGMLLQHLSDAKVAALDLESAQLLSPAQAQQLLRAATQGSTTSLRDDACFDQLALLQLCVPAAGAYKPWVYAIEVPQQQEAAAALMRHLQPLLQDAAVVKVMHDARQDSVILQRQFGITLRGVLDTQLLAGVVGLAAALPGAPPPAAAAAAAAAATAAPQGDSAWGAASGSGNGGSSGSYLGRLGLSKLYAAYGCPHPHKDAMRSAFDADPRCDMRVRVGPAACLQALHQPRARVVGRGVQRVLLCRIHTLQPPPCYRHWFQRPLPASALRYAADDVRYLLLVAQQLLQHLPAALMRAADLQMALAQEGAAALQLRLSQVPGYAPLLQAAGVAAAAASASGAGDGAVRRCALTSLQFELQLSAGAPGWLMPSYVVYLSDAQQVASGSAAGDAAAAAGEAGGTAACLLAGVSGSQAVLETARSCGSGSGVTGVAEDVAALQAGSAAAAAAAAGAAGDEDEAVLSMMQLLPDRWGRSVLFFLSTCKVCLL
jgi:hypothetical protein